MAESKKLYKTKEGAQLGGVLKGFSEVYDLDVSMVRIIFVVLALLGVGSPLLLYLILYLILPDKKDIVQPKVDPKDDYTVENDEYYY